MKKIAVLLCACGASVSFAAGTIDAAFQGVQWGQTYQWTNFGGPSTALYAGQIRNNLSNGTVDGAQFNGQYITFCAELTDLDVGAGTYNVVPVTSVPSPGGINAVKAQAIYDIFTDYGASVSILGGPAVNDRAAAFQALIWEIIYDFDGTLASIDYSNGNVDIASAVGAGFVTEFNLIKASIDGSGSSANVLGLANDTLQDQLIYVVPAPSAFALLGLGGLVAGRRRR